MKTYVILGAGGFAREVFWHLRETDREAKNAVFVDDVTERTQIVFRHIGSYPVVKDWDFRGYQDSMVGFIVGIGDPVGKEIMVKRALAAGLKPAPTVVHPRAQVQGPDCEIGVGGIITPGCVVTTNVKIGDYVILNLNCTVGHDSVIEDYVTCNPGTHLSGNTHVGKCANLGSGTVVRDKITIAPYVVTGAQACVVSDIDKEGITAVGVPAREVTKP